ncbi:hypothetical protein ACFRQM_04455 [Streptomyces sp. NPDC056831]|uniref:hypothetical protein n=1 Tax=Streptomyces sp. NPDC056831 TaxID=3345954 RepID=UPI0036956E82
MDTYTTGRSRTGHHRRPGTHLTYCGRHALARTSMHTRMCRACVKAEARDRAEAAAVAEQHLAEAPAAPAPAPARPRRTEQPAPTYIYGAQQLVLIGQPHPIQGALFAAH